MKTSGKIACLLLVMSISLPAWSRDPATETQEERDARMQWWREARFGMFIHWGPYAILGGVYNGHQQRRGGAEWIMNRCKIPVAEYKEIASTFHPVKFDAESIVLMAKNAGMKYIVITAKHHDGFAMFDSDASEFNIVDFTPYGKDVIEAMVQACRKHDMKLGFYYSQGQDWSHPGGGAHRKLSAEGWDNPDAEKVDAFTQANDGLWDPAQMTATTDEYIHNVALPQVRELLSNYGEIAVLWWDTPKGITREYAQKFHDLLKLQPNIITNDRLMYDFFGDDFPGDTGTPEQKIPGEEELDGRDWETCMTMGSSWGYKSWDQKWKSPEKLIRNLCRIASRGGNYLLNIGPDGLGQVPEQSVDALKEIGDWMKVNGEAIYATKASPLGSFPWGYCTRKTVDGKTVLYFFVTDWPENAELLVPGLVAEVLSAELMADGTVLETAAGEAGLTISLPEEAPDPIASAIKVKLNTKLKAAKAKATKEMDTGALD